LIIGFCMILLSLVIQILTIIISSYIISLPFGTFSSSPPLLLCIFTTLIHYLSLFYLYIMFYICMYFSSEAILKVLAFIIFYAYILGIVILSQSSIIAYKHLINLVISVLTLIISVALILIALRRTEIK
jgi:hypothetical protein